MTTNTTLISPQPKQETRRNQILGLFEDTAELILEGSGNLVNESPDRSVELKTIGQMPDHRIGLDRPPERLNIGGKTEIPFNNPDQIQYQKILGEIKHFDTIDKQVEQIAKANEMLPQSIREVVGMDDAELAKASRYNNEGYRGENLRSRHNLLEAAWNFIQDLFNKAKEKVTIPIQILSKRVSSKGAVSGAATPGDNKALYHQNAVDGQGIVTSTHGVG